MNSLVAILIAISFAAGLNVYATVASIGLLGRTGLLTLPPALHLLQDRGVIGVSLALFVIEFFVDKTPVLDVLWNSLHTFVRVPVAALLAYGATSHLAPEMKIFCTTLGALIALVAHGGKTAARAAVTASPEPISNISLSFAEDGFAVVLTWLATKHPYVAAAISLMAIVAIVGLLRFVIRSMRACFYEAVRLLES